MSKAGEHSHLPETTEWLLAQARSREIETRHRLLIGSLAQAVWEADASGMVVADSTSWRAYTGQTVEEWLGFGWLNAIHPEDRAHAERQWRDRVAARELVNAEFRLRAPDGGWRWTNIRAAPVLDSEGRVEKWVGMNLDISERKEVEAELRRSEARLRTLFDSIDEGYVEMEMILGSDGRAADWRYLALNPAFKRLTGMEDVTGRLISDILPDLEPEWAERYTALLETGEPIRFELPAARIGQWFEVYCARIGGADSRRVVAVYNDVTERKRANLALRGSEERQTFLLTLSDALRAEEGVEAVGHRAVVMIAEQLGVDRVYLVTLSPDDDEVVVTHETRREGLPPLKGSYRSSDFPNAIKEIFKRTIVYDDVRSDERLTELDRLSFAGLDAAGFMAASLRRGEGKMIWAAGAVSAEPRRWRPSEVTLFEDAIERTWAAIERTRAETAMRDSEAKLAAAFESVPAGLAAIDRDGRSILANAEYRRFLPAAIVPSRDPAQEGRWRAWDEHGHRVASQDFPAARALRGERVVPGMEMLHRDDAGHDVWVTVATVPTYDGAGTITGAMTAINDITDRKRAEAVLRASEERQVFLLKLSDALRPLADPEEVQRAATRLLGEHLGASRVFYVVVESDGETGTVHADYTHGVPSRTGRYSLSAFSTSALEAWRLGIIASTSDVDADARYSADERLAYAAVSTRAGVGVPLVKNGRLAAILGINQSTPREWTEQELSLASEVADRTWAAVERARAEAALRSSETERRTLIEEMNEGFCILEVILDDTGNGVDYRFLETNPAFVRQGGFDPAGRLMSEIAPIEPIWPAAYGRVATTGVPERIIDAAASFGRTYDVYAFRIGSAADHRIAVFFSDITERKRMESALREEERFSRALVEGVPQLVWRAVDRGDWTWASPQWTDYTGQTEADSHDKGWLDPVHPDDRERVMAIWHDAMERGEFYADYRVCHAEERRYRWFQTRATPVRDDAGKIIEWLGTSTDVDDLRELQERQKVLVAELQHRTRNLLGVVRSMADKTTRASNDLPDFRQRFRDRLDALARVQGLLSRLNDYDRVTFDELIDTELMAMGEIGRIALQGPSGVRLRSSTVQTLAMGLHELATNAVKYGALGQPNGHLAVNWSLAEPDEKGNPWLHIDWRETGVAMPAMDAPAQGSGQGRELIERALPYQLGARTTYELGSDGVHCTIAMPVSASTVEEHEHA